MARRPHKKLDAWLKAIELTVETYRQTERLPGDEKFGLISQMRRAAVSIASNIAEGDARDTKKDFIRFLHNAKGSLSELDTQVVICIQLGYLSGDDCEILNEDIKRESKLLTGLIRYLKK
jgi:four helix bundle protein